MWRDASLSRITAPQTPRSDLHWRWWIAAAAAAAGCGACLAAWRRGGRKSSAEQPRTDFNGFLKAPPAPAAVPIASQPAQRGAAQRSATSFGSFLKNGTAAQPSQQRDPTSFGSFLKGAQREDALNGGKDGGDSAGASSTPGSGDGGAVATPAPDTVPVTVLFGTEFGFSKEIAEKLRDRLITETNYW